MVLLDLLALSATVAIAGAPYAPWAHEHWVWLSSDRSTQPAVEEFAQSFRDHKIPVGAIDIDSKWATGINNFIPDTEKFPSLGALVENQHTNGTMVILWATSMVDTDSSNYDEMVNNSYNIKDAFNGTTTLHWWHGDGLLLDYTNANAVAWWQDALDNVLRLGIDGFKVDGTDPFIIEYLAPEGSSGPVTYREYATDYYRHFFEYARAQNGEHCLIMSRPVDSYNVIGDELQVYLDFSPRDVMFSGWVGDQDPTFSGMQDALRNLLHSGWNNYTGFGTDIGGYRTGDGPLGRTAELFIRWAQMGAFLPLMENGGDKEHRPWVFDAPGSTTITDTYRAFVAAHYELQPYLLSHGAKAYDNNSSLVLPAEPRPLNEQDLIQYNNFSTYDYSLGPSIFVSPVAEANRSMVQVHLPATASGKGWFDWFDRNRTYPSNATVLVQTPLTTMPVFGLQGDIIPMHISTRYTSRGEPAHAGILTLAVHSPSEFGAAIRLREHMAPDSLAKYSVAPSKSPVFHRSGRLLRLSLEPTGRDVRWLIDGVTAVPTKLVVTVIALPCDAPVSATPTSIQAVERHSTNRSTTASHEMAKPMPLSRATQYAVPGNTGSGQEVLPAAYRVAERLPPAPSAVAPWWSMSGSLEGQMKTMEVFAGAGDTGLCVEVAGW